MVANSVDKIYNLFSEFTALFSHFFFFFFFFLSLCAACAVCLCVDVDHLSTFRLPVTEIGFGENMILYSYIHIYFSGQCKGCFFLNTSRIGLGLRKSLIKRIRSSSNISRTSAKCQSNRSMQCLSASSSRILAKMGVMREPYLWNSMTTVLWGYKARLDCKLKTGGHNN